MYVHDLSPFIWRITDDFGLRWYGFSYLLALSFAFLFLHWLVRRQRSDLTPSMVGHFMAICLVGALVGGRLGYCVFYSPDLFLKFKVEFPFWGVLALNEGGMSSHGGMLGLAVVATVFAVRRGMSRLYMYDLIAISGAMGICFGRIANFINGELVGRPVDPSFPLAVKFPTDIYQWPAYEPARLADLAPVVAKIPGLTQEQWLQWLPKMSEDEGIRLSIYESLRKVVEAIQNGALDVKEALAPLLVARHPSQLYAAVFEGFFIFIFLFVFWYRPRRPGLVCVAFLILFSVVNLVDECFRMPDPQIGFQWFDSTRTQWLSGGMLLLGLALAFIWGRRETLRIPGWGRGHSVKLHRR